ncbi:MAG: HAMP domain-containing histidine kinase [Clostridiales bacterium]|nr:HAMP domain-containing histidine kinase [Clostridiales bacterium]
MQIAFMIIMFILVLLFYLSNPSNKINQWCTISGFLFWLGVAKQAVMFDIIPALHTVFGTSGLDLRFAPIHSACTWALYTLAVPTMLLASAYFCGFDKTHPNFMSWLKRILFLPALVITFFFTPLHFREYQLNSHPFWLTYTIYNFCLGAIVSYLLARGIHMEAPGKPKRQKKQVAIVLLPPLYYWLISIFIPHLFQITNFFNFWQTNVFLMLVCFAIFVIMAFRDGFMGLKLSRQTYDWDTNMSLINTSAEYTGHMLKNQTSKMELCIEQLKAHYLSPDTNEEVAEELAILSRSITFMRDYIDKFKNHSQIIDLYDEPCRITDLLTDAISGSLIENTGIEIRLEVGENDILVCDKSHMTEVLSNVIKNAAEAISGSGMIEIIGTRDKSGYHLWIKDDGAGIDSHMLKKIFTPYFTTKSTEKNFGLGLAYCKNVVTKHGGSISAQSKCGKGTTIIITFPAKRLAVSSTPGHVAGQMPLGLASWKGYRQITHKNLNNSKAFEDT